MSHFYASIQGARQSVTRTGSKSTGIRGHIRGWRKGIRVIGFVDSDGVDRFKVYETGGSSGLSLIHI